MNTTQKYSPEVRERAVRMVFERQGEHESQWAAINSIASKIGCAPETLRLWAPQAERDQGKRAELTRPMATKSTKMGHFNQQSSGKAQVIAGSTMATHSESRACQNAVDLELISIKIEFGRLITAQRNRGNFRDWL